MNIKHKLAAALTLAVLIVPSMTLAQALQPPVASTSTSDTATLQALIQTLLAEVASLEAQLTAQGGTSGSGTASSNGGSGDASQPATASWCYAFNANLSMGMSGAAVSALQTALEKDGESVQVTGIYDDQTAAAVTSFQEKYTDDILAPYSLSNGTGYVGATTRAKLNALFGCSSRTGTPTPGPIKICPAWGCNGPEPVPVRPITTSTTPETTGPTLTVTAASNQQPAGMVVMGTMGNILGAFQFSEPTGGSENVVMTSMTVEDSIAAPNNAPSRPGFTNVSLWTSSGQEIGVAAAPTAVSNTAGASIYAYTFNFSSPVGIMMGSPVTYILKGDAVPYTSGGATDDSQHQFFIPSASSVTARGAVSYTPATVMVSNAFTNIQTLLRSTMTMLVTPSGGTFNTGGPDNLGTITLMANAAGPVALGKITVTFTGTGVTSALVNSAMLVDASGLDVTSGGYATKSVQAAAAGTASGDTVTWTFDNGPYYAVMAGTSANLALSVNGSLAAIPAANTSATISAMIERSGDVTYTDAVNGQGTSGLTVAQSIFPVTIGSAQYGGSVNTTTPSITVTSPTFSSAWNAGTDHTITWTAQGTSGYFGINLQNLGIDGDAAITQIATNIPSTARSYDWAIPSNLPAGQYKVQVWSDGALANVALSSAFTIVAAPTVSVTPVITSIDPAQGAASDTITIYGNNLNTGGGPTIDFYGSNGALAGTIYFVSMNYISSQSIVFTPSAVNGGLAAGTYQVQVVTPDGRSNTEYFTLTAAANPPPAPVPYISRIDSVSSLVPGGAVTLDGMNFDIGSTVDIDGVQSVNPSAYTSTYLDFMLPTNISAGTHTLWIAEKASNVTSNKIVFTVSNPVITPPAAPTYAGTLNINLDASTPAAGTVSSGATGVKFALMDLSAVGGNVNVQFLTVVSNEAATLSGLSNVKIYNGSTLLGTGGAWTPFASGSGGYMNISLASPLAISSGSTDVLTLTADVASSMAGSMFDLGIGGGGGNYNGWSPNYSVYGNIMTVASTLNILGPIKIYPVRPEPVRVLYNSTNTSQTAIIAQSMQSLLNDLNNLLKSL